MSKIIVIDGMDGSGKHTQASLLYDKLSVNNPNVYMLSFPRYGESSETLVDMYLHGHINKDPMKVNPYAASLCYAMDRYISYERYWKDWVECEDGIIIFDRYISSNALHQAPKLKPEDRTNFISWLHTTENMLLGLPCPDIEIFLDVPTAKNIELVEGRYSGDDSLKDLRENITFQQICHECFEEGKDTYFKNMKIIQCTNEMGDMRPIDDINDDILDLLKLYDII